MHWHLGRISKLMILNQCLSRVSDVCLDPSTLRRTNRRIPLHFRQRRRRLCWSIEPVAVSIPEEPRQPNKPQCFEDGLKRRLSKNTQGVVSWDTSSRIPYIIQLSLWRLLLDLMDTTWGETAALCSAVECLKWEAVAAGCNQLKLRPGVRRVAESQYQWDKLQWITSVLHFPVNPLRFRYIIQIQRGFAWEIADFTINIKTSYIDT